MKIDIRNKLEVLLGYRNFIRCVVKPYNGFHASVTIVILKSEVEGSRRVICLYVEGFRYDRYG